MSGQVEKFEWTDQGQGEKTLTESIIHEVIIFVNTEYNENRL